MSAPSGTVRRGLPGPGVPATSLDRIAPGLAALMRYDRANIGADVRAGLAVAAVAIPVGISYAELAGFRPEYGLYASFFPLIVYALLGSSPQLIVGPDAATCAVIAASIAPLAAGDTVLYAHLAGMLTLIAGLICVLASFLRLGALADFLSKPILVGLLNGIAITIVLGQVAKLLGFPVASHGLLPVVFEVAGRLGETNPATLALGIAALLVVGFGPRLAPAMPAGIVAMVLAAAAVAAFGLERMGVATLGAVPGGLPLPSFPAVDPAYLPSLITDAASVALVSYASLIFSCRSFASRNGYEVDADQEFAALGAANIVSGLTQGFAVSGADSRTAVGDANGGRTHATGLVAAAVVGFVILFLTGPLRFVPTAALGAVLVFAGLSLFDAKSLRLIFRADRVEGAISVLAMLGVVGLGVTRGVLLAVILALLRFVQLTSRPRVEVLGTVEGLPGFHSLSRHKSARPLPGLVVVRFNGPLVFFNTGHFRKAVLAAVDARGAGVARVVLDLIPITKVDVSGILALQELRDVLASRGILLEGAGRRTEWLRWAEKHGFGDEAPMIYPTLRRAVREEPASTDAMEERKDGEDRPAEEEAPRPATDRTRPRGGEMP